MILEFGTEMIPEVFARISDVARCLGIVDCKTGDSSLKTWMDELLGCNYFASDLSKECNAWFYSLCCALDWTLPC